MGFAVVGPLSGSSELSSNTDQNCAIKEDPHIRQPVSLFHGSQIFVEPVERFLYHLSSRYVVSRIVNHAALVLCGCSQQTEHGLLRDSGRPNEIETAIEHQN